jgi:hypothetical protein
MPRISDLQVETLQQAVRALESGLRGPAEYLTHHANAARDLVSVVVRDLVQTTAEAREKCHFCKEGHMAVFVKGEWVHRFSEVGVICERLQARHRLGSAAEES